MMFVLLNGDKKMYVNMDSVTFVEETEDGCKIHLGVKTILTNIPFDDFVDAHRKTFEKDKCEDET